MQNIEVGKGFPDVAGVISREAQLQMQSGRRCWLCDFTKCRVGDEMEVKERTIAGLTPKQAGHWLLLFTDATDYYYTEVVRSTIQTPTRPTVYRSVLDCQRAPHTWTIECGWI
jgi:hypothetical protein